MPVDLFAVLQALLRADACRARRAERREPTPPAPKPVSVPKPAGASEPSVTEPSAPGDEPAR
ncbi:hypothetical protein [Streptomyces sp. CBMA370]|uniref:hypothetical protein n=1 Tax=Streptomyces sp. CBMA370 TaxID=1930278 RepID=UPI001661C37D|nr:hypothetical protein [Streptomyces sp. CBMA370]MBD0716194.1 hypothetical protein [Streptomyces sp. CBMA370]